MCPIYSTYKDSKLLALCSCEGKPPKDNLCEHYEVDRNGDVCVWYVKSIGHCGNTKAQDYAK